MRRLYLSIIFSAFSLAALAQTGANCTQTIRLIRSTYEQGRLHELPGLADGCLNPRAGQTGFTKEEKREAYRYLTLAYIYLEEPDSADINMLKLLETDHFYQVNSAVDPAEFIALFKKFRTEPVFRVGIKFGLNAAQPVATDYYNVGSSGAGLGKYGINSSFQAMLVFEKDITKRIAIAPEIGYVKRSYTYTNPQLATADEDPTKSISNQTFAIGQNYLDLNVIGQYFFKNTLDFKTYAGVGVGFSYLLGSTNQANTLLGNGFTVTGGGVDDTKSYTSLLYSAIVVAGLKYRIGEIYVVADIRYQYGINNAINTSSRTNAEIGFDYQGQYNDHKLNTIMINGGIVLPIFKPKKLIK